jgi:CheY-like chemotaxis protein
LIPLPLLPCLNLEHLGQKANGVDYLREQVSLHFIGLAFVDLSGAFLGSPRRRVCPRTARAGAPPDSYADWHQKCLQKNVMSDQDRIFGKRILLVDDDQGARESIKLLLSIDRHSVIEARNGQEALELFHQGILDLVIIDYFMPQMKGSELAASIKMAAPLLPILMVTAYMEKLVDTTCPVDAILGKPFGIEELRQTIARLLN